MYVRPSHPRATYHRSQTRKRDSPVSNMDGVTTPEGREPRAESI